MEVLTGRLTANAVVKEISEGKQVVNFSIAVNDRYKTKGGERVESTRYFKCAYWATTAIAPFLRKGGLVELSGRIDVQVWNDKEGKAKGTLTMHVNNIKLLGNPRDQEQGIEKPAPQLEGAKDDLPF
ncbi:MAG TPA: single-stranded DNA-binding protein [Chitinophagaceae bacterium]|nr:single-stranded DNA-binding protein [Chitinophagaceae bacterium]